MKKLDNGTKVWVLKPHFPYYIIEGTIEKYRPQRIEDLELKYYSVYFEAFDREYLCAEKLLYTDQQKVIDARKTAIQEQITRMRSEIENGEKDIERITSNIAELKCRITECEKLLNG